MGPDRKMKTSPELSTPTAIYCPVAQPSTASLQVTGVAWNLLSFHTILLPVIFVSIFLQASSPFLLLKPFFYLLSGGNDRQPWVGGSEEENITYLETNLAKDMQEPKSHADTMKL